MTDPVKELDRDWLCRRIVEGAGDAVLFADREGRIRFWNAGAAAMFGWSAVEALGNSMDLIIPERLRGRHWGGWDEVMKTGHTRYGRDILAVPASRKDGAPLSIEFTIQMIGTTRASIVGASAIIRDVTDRFTRDREHAQAARRARGEGPRRGSGVVPDPFTSRRRRSGPAPSGRAAPRDSAPTPAARASSSGLATAPAAQIGAEPCRARPSSATRAAPLLGERRLDLRGEQRAPQGVGRGEQRVARERPARRVLGARPAGRGRARGPGASPAAPAAAPRCRSTSRRSRAACMRTAWSRSAWAALISRASAWPTIPERSCSQAGSAASASSR